MDISKIKFKQLSVRQRMSPFPNYLSMESISKEMKEVIGTCFNFVMLIFKEHLMYVFMDEEDFERVTDDMFNHIIKNSKFFHEMVKIIDKNGEDFVNLIEEIAANDVSTYSNKELVAFHKTYEKRYKFIYSRYFTILAVEGKLSGYLKDYLYTKTKKNVEDYFASLIVEPRAQVNGREELAALQLARKIMDNEKWKNYFSKVDPEQVINEDEELNKLFLQHEQDYFWITRDYEDPVLTYTDFIERMGKIIQDDPIKKLKEKEKNLELVSKKIKEIEEELKIDDEHKQLFAAIREGVHLKELRKSYVSQSLFYYDPILKEIAKRAYVTVPQIRHLKIDEVEKIFDNEDLQQELNKRVKLSCWVVDHGKTSVLIDKEAQELYQKLCIVDKNISEVKGYAASPGVAKGPVRIIMNPSDFHKMEQGDVLVSGQIVPVFAQLIKMAVAVVCDGGTAVTSHPAILSREAKIPCVTGTNVATQVFKDGDIVEVNGSKGLVKKVKK